MMMMMMMMMMTCANKFYTACRATGPLKPSGRPKKKVMGDDTEAPKGPSPRLRHCVLGSTTAVVGIPPSPAGPVIRALLKRKIWNKYSEVNGK